MIDVPAAAKNDLERRLSRELGQRVVAWSLTAGGAQNRSFRLDTASGTALLAKFYHQDRWDRLHREFSALTLLGRHGLAHLPRAYLRSDEFSYGVYSFEPGRPKSAIELESDDLRAVAAFVADLHRLAPSMTGEDLSPAVDASFCIEQQLGVIDGRLRAFETFAGSPEAYEEVRDLCRALDLRAVITELIRRGTASMDAAERRAALPRSAWRVNTADFGPQNLLFTSDGQFTALDFEASGWDDPARLVMGFVAHAATEDLRADHVATFLAAYAEACALSESEIARFERVGVLYDLEWVAIYASALTGEAVAAKQFASRAFDRPTYLAQASAKLKRRLARAMGGAGYRFPAD